MFLPVLLLLGILTLPHSCGKEDRVVFKRALYEVDAKRQLSVHLNVESSEALQLHVVLAFGWPGKAYHNALFFHPRHHLKYKALTGDSNFPPQRDLDVISKDQLLRLQFEVGLVGTEEKFVGGHKLEYDALISLDYHSSLWNEWNTARFEEARVTLLMDTREGKREKGEFVAVYHIHCEKHRHPHRKGHCGIGLGDHRINGREIKGEAGRLVINLDSPHNLLPPELFARWKFHGEKNLRVTDPDGKTILLLNSQFRYLLNEHGDDIVVGIDLVHHFQKVEYSPHRGHVTLWHSWMFQEKETFDRHKNIIYYFISLILTCLTYWYTSTNYDIFTRLLPIVAKRDNEELRFEFPYCLIIVELVSLLLAISIWFIVFLSGGEPGNPFAMEEWPVVLQRRLAIFLISFYHVLLSLALFIKTHSLTLHAFRYYYSWVCFKLYARKGTEGYAKLKTVARSETESVPVKLVLLRNLTCHTVSNTSLLLILNFLSEEKALYNIPFILFSLGLLYFYVKTLFTTLLYVSSVGGGKRERLLTIVCSLSGLLFLIYTLWTIEIHYTLFILRLNSLFTERVVNHVVNTMLCFTIVGALLSIFVPLVEAIHTNRRKPLPEVVDK